MKKSNPSSSKLPHIIKVEASAGAGKTRVIAKRYIEILFNASHSSSDIPTSSILAITFTNKASIEMKSRILAILKSIAFNTFSTAAEKKEFFSITNDSLCDAQKKAACTIEHIIRHYDMFKVQTIDSFINEVLTGSIFKAGRSAGYKIIENHADYLTYSFDTLIEQANSDASLRTLLEDFIRHYLYIKDNPPWIPKHDIIAHIENLYTVSNTYGMHFTESNLTDKDLLRVKGAIGSLLEKMWQSLPEGTDQRFARTLQSLVERKRFTANDFKKTFLKNNFPVTKKYSAPPAIEKMWQALQKTIRQFCECESLSLYNPYISIYNNAYDYIDQRARKDDVIFLAELNKRIYELIASGIVSLPELCCRTAPNLRHYLIDEFQDTSVLHWNNLAPFIEEALAASGSFFYVGDKKQAIYRFRGGEPQLFDNVPQFLSSYKTHAVSLNENYRSQKAIVDFNNTIFSEHNLHRGITEMIASDKNAIEMSHNHLADVLRIFHGAHQEAHPNNAFGYVHTETVDGNDSDECDEVIADKIVVCIRDTVKRGFSYGDIALLARSNSDVETLTGILLAEDINVVSDKTLSLKENRHVNEILSFLQFLNSPIDNCAFASFILGDIFLKATGLRREEMEQFIFSLRTHNKEKRPSYFYTAFRAQFHDVWESYVEKEFFKKVGIFPLYEFVRHIFEIYKIFDHFPHSHAFFMRFLEFVKELEDEHVSLSSFLDYVSTLSVDDKRLYVHIAETTNAVKIITYHKAKGLEFPIVIVPYLSFQIKVNKLVPYAASGSAGGGRIQYLLKSYCNWSKSLLKLYQEEYAKSLIDELNILYVALTRARYELFCFIPVRIEGKKRNRASFLFTKESSELGMRKKYAAYAHNTAQKRGVIDTDLLLKPVQYIPWMNHLIDEFIDGNKLIYRKAIRRGNVLHCILSYVGNCAEGDIDVIIKNALRMAQTDYGIIENIDEVETAIRSLINDKNLKGFFFVRRGTVYTEKNLVNIAGHTKRVDRLVVKDGEVIVIDYKSAREAEETQVREYIEILRTIYPDKQVRGYLIYIEDKRVEEVSL